MRKYIDAEELKRSFSCEEDAEYCRWTLAGVIDEIDDIEAADVQEVRRGRWEPYLNEGLIVKCSVCGSRYAEPWHYCPNCGAKMDEVEDNDKTL